MRVRVVAAALIAALVLVPSAVAEATISGTTGSVTKIVPPPGVTRALIGGGSLTTMYAWDEQQGVTLASNLNVDITTPGSYESNASLSTGQIPAGTVVDSHFFESVRPAGSSTSTLTATLSFPADILGVIVRRGPLGNSHVLGAPGTDYSVGATVTHDLELGTTADGVFMTSQRSVTIRAATATDFDMVRIITKHNQAPVVNAGGPYAATEGGSVTLAATASDIEGDPMNISWSFSTTASPGTVCTPSNTFGLAPSVTCNDDALVEATLSVADPYHAAVTSVANITFSNAPPVLGALTVPTAPVPLANAVTTTASFTDAGTHDTHTATVDWGDTTSSNATIAETNGSGTLNASHTYANPGIYTITVTLTDDDNGIATRTATVTVNGPPTADAGGPYAGTEGIGKTLAGTATDPEDPVATTWAIVPTLQDAGTTCTSTGTASLTPVVTCDDDAVLDAELSADDGINPPVLSNTTVTINNAPPVLGAVTAPLGPIAVGATVNVSAPFTDSGANDTHTATVDWGDLDSSNASVTESGGNGSLQSSHAYSTSGLYTITVTLTDDNGGTDVKTVSVLVNTPPTVDASGGGGGEYVGLEGTSMVLTAVGNDTDGDGLSYSWAFTYSGDPGVVCTVTGPGTHAPTLTLFCTDDAVVEATVTVDDGVNAPVSDDATLTVGNANPVAGTVVQAPTAPSGKTVAISMPFTDAGSNDTHTATIDWGDSSSSAGSVSESGGSGTVTASHLYATDGNYTVTVTVTDDNGGSGVKSLLVTSDTTAPVITYSVAPAPNGGGWNNSGVTVTWTVTDSLSPIDSSTGCDPTTRTSDTPLAGITFTCSATSRGGTASESVTVKLDQVAPSLSGAPTSSPNPNGWYNAPVTIDWTCTDTLSGIAGSCPADAVLSSEGAAVTASATVSDNADNTTNASSAPVKIDLTAPATTASTLPEWNNDSVTLTLTATDNLSGVDATRYIVDGGAVQTGTSVLLTDEGIHTIDFWSVDNAGNVENTKTTTVKLDKSAPSISVAQAPLANGASWNKTNVTVTFTCADALSGIASCTAPQNVTAEGAGQIVTGTAVDNANNSASASRTLNIDKTPPSITGVVPPANGNGWYNGPVTLSWSCSDSLSGVATCPAATTFTLDGNNQSAAGTVTDIADNSATVTYTGINVDQTPPTISASVAPTPNVDGWNDGSVTVSFTCSDATSGIAPGACPADEIVSAEGITSVSGSVTDRAGNTATTTATVRIDTIDPSITGTQTPAPNLAGWNNTDVTVSFTCTDAGSGIAVAGCTAPVVVEEVIEGANQSVTGTAIDTAGNTASTTITGINVDQTPPVLTGTPTTAPNGAGWYSGPVTIAWTCSDALSGIAGSCPADSVITGEGNALTATASVTDVAGNTTTASSAPVKIDQTAPSTTASSVPSVTNTTLTITLTANDALSGVAATRYKIDGGATQTGTSVVLNTEGVHTVEFWSVDNAGNVEAAHTVTVLIDFSAPSITVTQSPAPNGNGWNNTDVTVTFTCSDGGAGVASCTAPVTVTTEGAAQTVNGSTSDNAGNTATASATLNIDKTAPTISGSAPPANLNGWYNAPVTVSFTCADSLSGIDSCTPPATLSSDGAAQSATGTAVDGAGNTKSATVNGINIDQVAPELTVSAPFTATGWYDGPVTVQWACSDNLSGVVSCPADVVVSSEGITTLAETITDQAGNSTTVDITVKIDKTPPTIVGSANPAPNGNGWNNTDVTVSFTCNDNLSGVVSCAGPVVRGEGAGQSASGSATDTAGNSASTTVSGINVDKTDPTLSGAPTTAANPNGWYNHAVTIHWTCGDALSGVDAPTCPGDGLITTEGVAQQLSRTVSDLAGNAKTAASAPVNVDLTAPVTTASVVPTAFTNTDVSITLSATDNLSGVDQTFYTKDGGPLTAGNSVTFNTDGVHTLTYYSVDNAGNTESVHTVVVRIDTDAPTITSGQAPAANGAGWNNTNVVVTFTCSDPLSGIASCTTPQTVGTNGAAQAVSGTAVDNAGNTASTTRSVSVDKVPPTISGGLSTTPNINGWINAPTSVSFTCTDALSGIASCTAPSTLGQGAGQSVTGSAVDVAGNSASTTMGPINIDLTAPVITAAADRPPDSGTQYTNPVTITFTCTDALSGIAAGACPAPVTVSASGVTTVTGSVTDRAGNVSTTSASVTISMSSAPNVRLLTLATTGKGSLTVSGTADIVVAGTIAVDSTDLKAMTVNGAIKVTATKVLINGSGGCSGCKSSNTSPLPSSGPYVADPLAALGSPSTTGLPVYNDGAYHGPGVYNTKLNLTGTTPLTMASGIYVLKQGISISGSSSITSAPGGVLLAATGGSSSFSGSSNITLAPMSSGPYAGVLFYQPTTNTSGVSISGTHSIQSPDATIYVPAAAMSVTGASNLKFDRIITKTYTQAGAGILKLE